MQVVLTYRDYAALPADGKRYELHEGELFVTAAPGTPHQRLVLALVVMLREHVWTRHLGEVFVSPIDCIMSDVTVVEPDIVFVGAERASVVSPRGIEGAPTLVVEVVSPSTASVDRGTKLQLYARYGVPFYWIVDGDARRIESHALQGGAYRLVAALDGPQVGALPPFVDLSLDAGRLWAALSRSDTVVQLDLIGFAVAVVARWAQTRILASSLRCRRPTQPRRPSCRESPNLPGERR